MMSPSVQLPRAAVNGQTNVRSRFCIAWRVDFSAGRTEAAS